MALHTCLRRMARANQALVKSGMQQAEAPFRQSERIYDPSRHRTIKPIASLRRGKGSALPLWFRKRELPAHSEAGTMATLIELASTPEIWMVKGFGGISNFTLFRMPSQPMTPLKLSVLHHVDPAGGRQVDGVPARRKRVLEYREPRKGVG